MFKLFLNFNRVDRYVKALAEKALSRDVTEESIIKQYSEFLVYLYLYRNYVYFAYDVILNLITIFRLHIS